MRGEWVAVSSPSLLLYRLCLERGKLDLTTGVNFGFTEVDTAYGHSEHPDITSLFRAPVCFRPEERSVVNG